MTINWIEQKPAEEAGTWVDEAIRKGTERYEEARRTVKLWRRIQANKDVNLTRKEAIQLLESIVKEARKVARKSPATIEGMKALEARQDDIIQRLLALNGLVGRLAANKGVLCKSSPRLHVLYIPALQTIVDGCEIERAS